MANQETDWGSIMSRLKFIVAYLGTHFAGWQLQPHERTIQGCLEKAMAIICNEPVRVYGSGRTDSGVHALGQVCHCDVPDHKTHIPWQRAMNALLPKDIAICKADYVPKDFHARRSAQAKEYAYTLWTEPSYVLPQRRPFVWPVGNLDVQKMNAAARMLTGQIDFAAFQNTGTPVKNTIRTIYHLAPEPRSLAHETTWLFHADSFLKQMARNIMGCLVAVGQNKLRPEDVKTLVKKRDRSLAPATAPPQGLCLRKVKYQDTSEPDR
jgi:tRNA pseudouridine38-40 synthase